VRSTDETELRAGTPAPAVPPIFRAVARPFREFFRLEAASGIVLLASAAAALAWANLGGAASYRAFVDARVAIALGPVAVDTTLHALVNDGLMTLFFFVVGMEIKRELVLGELRTLAQASLPLVAAAGGMIVPAAIYVAFNAGGPGIAGWGVPMATDIAFAIGVLTLLRSRVSHALVVFLTALAIFDDIGGILVIALFYGTGISAGWLAGAAGIAAAVVLLARWNVRSGVVWALGGGLLWYAVHHAGVHATISGVILGLLVPARPRVAQRQVIEALARHAGALAASTPDEELDAENVSAVEEALEAREALLSRFTEILHPWVAFVIMPVFALVNSGVEIGGLTGEQLTGKVAVGTAVALFVGKQVGIFGFTAAAVRLGLSPMPGGGTYGKLLGVSIVAGIGFTVALFIAGLAFPDDPALLDEAKLGILAGSLTAGIAGALVLRATAPVRR
jgi:NhaA family Na+:H+ antiporter